MEKLFYLYMNWFGRDSKLERLEILFKELIDWRHKEDDLGDALVIESWSVVCLEFVTWLSW